MTDRILTADRALRIACALLMGGLILGETLAATAQIYVSPRRGTPGRREGAGTRGCFRDNKKFVALIPDKPEAFAMSATKRPYFFWYVPETTAANVEFRAEFELKDRAGRTLYQTTVRLTKLPGIVGLQLPESVTSSLGIGEEYFWTFAPICNSDSGPPEFVEGVFQLTQPNAELTKQLQVASPNDLPKIYAAAGIWHDAIGILATQRCTQPNNPTLSASWLKLLQSVQLQRYANESLRPFCATVAPSSVP